MASSLSRIFLGETYSEWGFTIVKRYGNIGNSNFAHQKRCTWLDNSRSKSPFSRPRSFSETGRCACPYYIMQAHRFSNRLKTSLWGNKSKKSSISIASTYLFVKSKLYIECPVTPFQCPFFHVNFQFWLQSSLFYIFGSYYSAYQVSSFRFFLH